MGRGDRIKFFLVDAFGLGISMARFPFELTINVQIFWWILSVGIGKWIKS